MGASTNELKLGANVDTKPTIVFVSHSSQDRALATALVALLKAAIPGLPGGQTRCTSVYGHKLPTGAHIETLLRNDVIEAKVVIALITPSSLVSQYVMFELGARWGTKLPLVPLLAGVTMKDVKDPLRSLVADSAHHKEDLKEFVQSVAKDLGMGLYPAAKWSREIKAVKAAADAIPKRGHADDLVILKITELDEAIGTLEERLERAEKEVWISGNDNAFIRSRSAILEKELKRGLKIRLLGVDPDSHAAEMLHRIDPRFESKNFKSEISGVTEMACRLHARYPNLFEYKLLPILPAAGYFITDPKRSTKRVKVELYAAKPWKPYTRPHFVVGESLPEWRNYFIEQFKNYWKMSKAPCKPASRKAKAVARRSK